MMKKLAFIAFILCLSNFHVVGKISSDHVLNGGFEDWTDDSPDNWDTSSASVSQIGGTGAYMGNYALGLNSGGIRQAFSTSMQGPQIYTVSFNYLDNHTSEALQVYVLISYGGTMRINYYTTSTLDSNYHFASFEVDASGLAGVDWLRIDVGIPSGSSVAMEKPVESSAVTNALFLDNLSIVPKSEYVPEFTFSHVATLLIFSFIGILVLIRRKQ
ncbi:MAG: hypothetical protein ACXAC7_10360 [Candidatus Hodarchaeales archaeon]|jgi:hypothetical protein